VTEQIQTLLLLLIVLVIVAVVAQRRRIAPAILLVIAGIVVALVPGLPRYELAPEFVLLVVLPPLIYNAGVAMSWREFRFNLRPIGMLAIGCVVFTACSVAAALNWFLGLEWAVGFVLGAIVAPPDVIAPLSIARRLHMPRRVLVVLEGEGLANDATALIMYRFAVAAVSTGVFSFMNAAGTFALIVVGELAYGIAIGWVSLQLRRWARNPPVEITLSLMTPYIAYWVPQYLGGSGVLATVATGLYVSWNGPLMISAATRLQGIFFWDVLIYLVEGMVFLFTGLQMRLVVERISTAQIPDLLAATALTALVAIIARFVWVFPSTYLPRWLSKSLARRDPSPPWRAPFVVAFTGVRGVVSLSAALALPLTTAAGQPFPFRDHILFITFGIIVITLVGEGLLLPRLLSSLGLARGGIEERAREREAELTVRMNAIDAMRSRLDELTRERRLSDGVVAQLRAREEDRMQMIPRNLGDSLELTKASAALLTELIEEERRFLFQMLREGRLTDESRRRIERELDLEEAAIASRLDADAAS
jgi:CPA1 family monovalent cation:H+ antiporter